MQYYQQNKDKRRQQMAQYNALHKDEITAQRHQHYQLHREQILQSQSKVCNCDCGGQYTANHVMNAHKSIRHTLTLAMS